jgi:hypothetical protein
VSTVSHCPKTGDSTSTKIESNSLNARCILIPRIVYERANGVGGHLASRVRTQQRLEMLLILELGIEPKIIIVWRQNHRHAVMDVRHQLVGVGRDESSRVDDLIASMPMFSKTSKGEWPILLEPNEKRLLRLARFLPLVEAIGHDETSASLER